MYRAPNGATVTSPTRTIKRALPADSLRLSDAQARRILTSSGIVVYSSRGCTSRTSYGCTSFDTIRTQTIRGILALESGSGCAITVNAGTEVGHATGPKSHWDITVG